MSQATIYLLPSCKTCQRVLSTLREESGKQWTVRDIKEQPLGKEELSAFAKTAGSYESLFSRRAILYRQRNLKEQQLSEADYERLILEHYTFLKRPVMAVGDQLFIGSAKKTVAAAAAATQE